MSVANTPMPAAKPGASPDAPAAQPVVDNTNLPTQAQTIPAEPAPVVEPVAPAVETPVKLDLEAPAVSQATTTGNKTFDSVASLLTDKNVPGIDAMFENISSTGEVSLTDHAAIISALGETVGGLVVNQLKTEVTNIRTAATAKSEATLGYMATKFNTDPAQSAQSWADLQAFVKTPESGFSDADRVAMTQMIQAGGMQAELVIDKIHATWVNRQGFTQPAELISGDTTAHTSFTPLSKMDYSNQMREVTQKYGYNSHQAEALRNLRTKSIGLGY